MEIQNTTLGDYCSPRSRAGPNYHAPRGEQFGDSGHLPRGVYRDCSSAVSPVQRFFPCHPFFFPCTARGGYFYPGAPSHHRITESLGLRGSARASRHSPGSKLIGSCSEAAPDAGERSSFIIRAIARLTCLWLVFIASWWRLYIALFVSFYFPRWANLTPFRLGTCLELGLKARSFRYMLRSARLLPSWEIVPSGEWSSDA